MDDMALGIKKGRKIVYTGDTRPVAEMPEFARNADVLILEKYDFILINIKGTDIAGHDKKPLLKKEVIEKVDSVILPNEDLCRKSYLRARCPLLQLQPYVQLPI